jgi:hypothetical protein
MRVKHFLLNLGWLEIWLQLRFGRRDRQALRRYRPASRRRTERAHDRLLHQLADTFSPERGT